MRQLTFATQPSFEKYARKSRREEFLSTMQAIIPWAELEERIAPHYPKAGKGRQPVGLSVMLRIYFLQHWFALSDPGAEDALYESPVLRGFCGIDLGRAPVPDETTILNFRHLLEGHDLCGEMLDVVNDDLASRGCALRPARSSMRQSSLRRVRPRTKRKSVTPRCIRRAKAISGTSARRRISESIVSPAWCIRSAPRRRAF